MTCDKVILITGAASGIGAHAAKYFSKEKARLVLVDKNETGLKAVSRDCGDCQFVLIRADLTRPEDASRVIRQTIDAFGRLDILTNIAGDIEFGGIESTSLDQLERMFAVNVKITYQLTMLSVPHLIASRGVIVNVSSCLSMTPHPQTLAYSMAKAALDHFTKSVAVELAAKGVRVNAVNPGVVSTPLLDNVVSDPEAVRRLYGQKTPLGRVGTVDDVVNLIGFLVSDKASYMTGSTVPVDGALHLGKH